MITSARPFKVLAAASVLSLAGGGAAQASAAQSGLSAPLAHSVGIPVSAASANHRLQLILGLNTDTAGLKRFATAVSTPGSAVYRQFLQPAEIAERFGAPLSQRASVIEYLRSNGVSARAGYGGFWIEANPTVAQASRIFSTHFASFRGGDGGARVASASRATVPPALRSNVTTVLGLNELPTLHTGAHIRAKASATRLPSTAQALAFNDKARKLGASPRANMGTQAGCTGPRNVGSSMSSTLYTSPYTPNEYLTAYGYTQMQAQGLTGRGQSVAVVEIDGFARTDLVAAGNCFGYKAPPTPLTRVGISKALSPDTETTLDLQVLSAAAPGLDAIRVYEGSSMLSSLPKLFAAPLNGPAGQRASVISSSIGGCEYGTTGGLTKLMDAALTAAASQGVTVLSAAGDSGSTDCGVAGNTAYAKLAVDYPASSQWVTSVGGTNLNLDPTNQSNEEVVWNDEPLAGFGAGGGGYSRIAARPAWQTGPGVNMSRNSRSAPDLAMLADSFPGYAIYEDNQDGWTAVGGTSAATPLLAAGVALTNQQATAAGKATMGFINPAIYSLAAGSSASTIFRDVTSGSNDLGRWIAPTARVDGKTVRTGGTKHPLGCCTAAPNYDPASGWGSINLPAFSAALVAQR